MSDSVIPIGSGGGTTSNSPEIFYGLSSTQIVPANSQRTIVWGTTAMAIDNPMATITTNGSLAPVVGKEGLYTIDIFLNLVSFNNNTPDNNPGGRTEFRILSASASQASYATDFPSNLQSSWISPDNNPNTTNLWACAHNVSHTVWLHPNDVTEISLDAFEFDVSVTGACYIHVTRVLKA